MHLQNYIHVDISLRFILPAILGQALTRLVTVSSMHCCTSTSALSTSVFDDLVFLRFKLDENLLYIYDLNINSEEFGKYPANKTQTIQEQKNQGRRPHVSLQTLFVDANNLEPDIIFDIRRCKAYNRVSEYYQRLIGK